MLQQSFQSLLKFVKNEKKLLSITFLFNIFVEFLMQKNEFLFPNLGSEFSILNQFFFGALQAWSYLIIATRIKSQTENYGETYKETLSKSLLIIPPTLMYGLLYGLAVGLGLVFAIVPGIIIAIVYFYVPYFAMFDIEMKESYFSESKKYIKGNVIVTSFFLVLTFFFEFLSFGVMNLIESGEITHLMAIIISSIIISFSLIAHCMICEYFLLLLRRR